jgi:HemX protein
VPVAPALSLDRATRKYVAIDGETIEVVFETIGGCRGTIGAPVTIIAVAGRAIAVWGRKIGVVGAASGVATRSVGLEAQTSLSAVNDRDVIACDHDTWNKRRGLQKSCRGLRKTVAVSQKTVVVPRKTVAVPGKTGGVCGTIIAVPGSIIGVSGTFVAVPGATRRSRRNTRRSARNTRPIGGTSDATAGTTHSVARTTRSVAGTGRPGYSRGDLGRALNSGEPMIALAHFVAISCYIGSVAVAAAPFARPVRAPVGAVAAILGAGVAVHIAGLIAYALSVGAIPLTGLGPSLSFAGLVLAATLVTVELLARDVSLTVIAAPLAVVPTLAGILIGLVPGPGADGIRGLWLFAHVALSFVGIAAFGTAAAAGGIYLIERRELKARHFGVMFRFFPPLATLDRVNHLAAIAGWLSLTVGVILAGTYAATYGDMQIPHFLWAIGAWAAVSFVALGRVMAGWQARRAALYSSVAFAAVLVVYLAIRMATGSAGAGKFL